MNNATATAKTLRQQIRAAGIKARVRVSPASRRAVQINAPAYGVEFTETEQRTIRAIAVANSMTLVQGMPINVEQMTNPETFEFYV